MCCCTICTKTLKIKWYITSYKAKNIVPVHTISSDDYLYYKKHFKKSLYMEIFSNKDV